MQQQPGSLACKYCLAAHAGKDRRPIVEFAVENAQTMKKREQRETGRKGSATPPPLSSDSDDIKSSVIRICSPWISCPWALGSADFRAVSGVP